MEELGYTSKQLIDGLSSPDPVEKAWATQVFWHDVDHWFAWFAVRTFRGVNVVKKADGWLAVVKASNRQGKPEVAFVGGSEPGDVWWLVAYAAANDLLRFKPDKWAKD